MLRAKIFEFLASFKMRKMMIYAQYAARHAPRRSLMRAAYRAADVILQMAAACRKHDMRQARYYLFMLSFLSLIV